MSKWLSSKSLQITNVGEDRNKRESCYTVVGIINWFKHWKTVWRFCRKLKIQLLYHQTIPLLGIYPKKMKTLIQKDKCTSMFIALLFIIAKIWKQLMCPSTNEWIKNMWYINDIYAYDVYIYNGIVFSHIKE